MPSKSLLLTLTGVAVAVASLAWYSGSRDTASSAVVIDAADQAAPSRDVSPAQAAAAASLRAAKSAAAGRALSARVEFEHANDLYAYARSLAGRERAGDPEALWLVSRVHEYCMGYAMNPAGYAGDTRAMAELRFPNTAALVTARERVSRRCARFLPSDNLSPRFIVARRKEAAEAGSVAAEASLLAMGTPLSDSGDYKKDLVQRVLISRDPEAYVAISPAMGIAASEDVDSFGDVSGTALTELAWVVAACQLGQECGPDSTLMTTYCANGGICSRNSSQDFNAFVLDAGVPRQGADKLEEMVDTLLYNPGVVK
ncbi:hypothetical protein [Pseudoxanthomonas sp. UTMC 1351]|uniref:hypothetical protein n=1 Tax=Pseudoxanthomonas sp. UTMC 1351 TaxID=2695853 RepID=UPI0034CD4013